MKYFYDEGSFFPAKRRLALVRHELASRHTRHIPFSTNLEDEEHGQNRTKRCKGD